MFDGAVVAREALRLQGTRFRHQGRSVSSGLDCVGLAVLAYAAAGVELDAAVAYRAVPDEHLLPRMARQQLGPARNGRPLGGLVIFRWPVQRGRIVAYLPIHAGIVVQGGYVDVRRRDKVLRRPWQDELVASVHGGTGWQPV